MAISKIKRRKRIKSGIRKKISGTSARPRLSVFRSNKEIYAQLIDDDASKTLLAVSSQTKGIETKGTKSEVAEKVGELLGERALEAGFSKVAFDRNGYLFHGRVKALAEGARKSGLKF